jgi:hypothetical protein
VGAALRTAKDDAEEGLLTTAATDLRFTPVWLCVAFRVFGGCNGLFSGSTAPQPWLLRGSAVLGPSGDGSGIGDTGARLGRDLDAPRVSPGESEI